MVKGIMSRSGSEGTKGERRRDHTPHLHLKGIMLSSRTAEYVSPYGMTGGTKARTVVVTITFPA